MSDKVAKLLCVESNELPENACSKCEDMGRLVTLLKQKMLVLSKQKQVQLLTLVPQSWTIAKTATEFNISKHKVKQARKLKSEKGILAEVKPKVGKLLSKDVEERVTACYEEDEHSWLLPVQSNRFQIHEGV